MPHGSCLHHQFHPSDVCHVAPGKEQGMGNSVQTISTPGNNSQSGLEQQGGIGLGRLEREIALWVICPFRHCSY